ncbi:hypothetical protein PCANC_12575, partial [Puccinia coronata f. sp. avenae]
MTGATEVYTTGPSRPQAPLDDGWTNRLPAIIQWSSDRLMRVTESACSSDLYPPDHRTFGLRQIMARILFWEIVDFACQISQQLRFTPAGSPDIWLAPDH